MIVAPDSRDFLKEIIDLDDGGDIKFNVVKILTYTVRGVEYVVHTPYQSDGFSIPNFLKFFFRALFRRRPLLIYAAILHDYLYSKSRALERSDKYTADLVFYLLMRHYGAGWFVSKLFLAAVEAFGSLHYRKRDDLDYTDSTQTH